jgi:hypothetical protein
MAGPPFLLGKERKYAFHSLRFCMRVQPWLNQKPVRAQWRLRRPWLGESWLAWPKKFQTKLID